MSKLADLKASRYKGLALPQSILCRTHFVPESPGFDSHFPPGFALHCYIVKCNNGSNVFWRMHARFCICGKSLETCRREDSAPNFD